MSYADEIRQKITSDLRARAREHDAGGLPFVAAVCRETADNIDRAVARATAEGLRRIGVAVAVWAGMAAERERATGVIALSLGAARCDSARAQRMHRIALDLAAELHAERAARRKWELRLRARVNRPFYPDRLGLRALMQPTEEAPLVYHHGVPIAGPRGVLP